MRYKRRRRGGKGRRITRRHGRRRSTVRVNNYRSSRGGVRLG